MLGDSDWQLFKLIILIPLTFFPSIIALKKNHPYKIPIVLINVYSVLLWVAGCLISVVYFGDCERFIPNT